MIDEKKIEKGIKIRTIIALLLFIGVLCLVLKEDEADASMYQDGLVKLSDGWTVEYDTLGGNHYCEEISLPITLDADISDEGVDISRTISEEYGNNTYFYYDSYHQDIDVYVDDELIVSWGGSDNIKVGKAVPKKYCYVPMREEYKGHTIRLHITGPYSDIRSGIGVGYLGGEKQFNKMMIKTYGVDLVFGITFIVIGVIWIVIHRIIYKSFQKYTSIVHLGLFSLLFGVWILTYSRGRQLYITYLILAEKVSYVIIGCMFIPILHYVDARQKYRYNKSSRRICILLAVITILALILDIMGIVDMHESAKITIAFLLLSVIYVMATIINDYIRKRAEGLREITIGFCIIMITSLLQTIPIYLGKIVLSDSNLLFYIGTLTMIIVMGSSYIREWIEDEKRNRYLDNANKTKSSFLANMSHEIRTPITAILGMDEMILKESDDEVICDYATKIQNSGKILLSLINDILDFSKIESGKMELVNSEYQVVQLFSDVVTMIKTNAENKKLEFIVNIDENIPSKLYGDDIRIRQILINILNNAVKYTKQGSVTLTLTCGPVTKGEKDEVTLKVSVADTGIGIKKEDREKIFEAFGRVDLNYNRNIEGTGLGMSITSHFLNLMGTSLEVESEYGQGSVFGFELKQTVLDKHPIGDFETAYKEYQTRKEKEHAGGYVAPNAKVLVVDDNEMNLEVIKGLLKESEIQVTTIDRGNRAIELFKEVKYDLVFIDHMMPGMDGIETLAHIREYEAETKPDDEKTPIVVLTANAITGAKEMYMEKGFDDYLVKPIVLTNLLECIRRFLPAEYIIPVSNADKERKLKKKTANKESVEANDKNDDIDIVEYYLNKYGININEGIKFSAGKVGKYKMMLGIYDKLDDARRIKFNTYIDETDMENYAIEVHALKGNARSIGANTLADIAYEHEKKSKEKDKEYILANYHMLLDEMDICIKGVRELENDKRLLESVVEPTIQRKEAPDNKKVASFSDISIKPIIVNDKLKLKELTKIIALIEDYDRSGAIDALREWKEREPNEALVNVLSGTQQYLEDFEFDKALTNIKKVEF